MQAAKAGSVEHLQRLHGADAALLGAAARGIGHTALHWASANGHVDAVTWLLDAGAAVDARNSGDSTPLHSAAGSGHAAVVSLLLSRGADSALGDSGDETAADLARARGHEQIVTLLGAAKA